MVVGGVRGGYNGVAVSPREPAGTQLDIDWVGSIDQERDGGLGCVCVCVLV